MATNRADTLDPALLRPGRLDRKIEFPLPDRRQKRLIFSTITSKMNLSEEVDLEDCILLLKGQEGHGGKEGCLSPLPPFTWHWGRPRPGM